jgi:hypothetical protein
MSGGHAAAAPPHTYQAKFAGHFMAGEVFVPTPSGKELEVKVIEELWDLSSALRRPLRRHCVGAGKGAR